MSASKSRRSEIVVDRRPEPSGKTSMLPATKPPTSVA